MAEGRIDRRVARTRALLQRAHLALIVEHGYEAVTVEDICKAADVGRSTFYAHYSGKDELKRAGLDALKRQLLQHQLSLRAGSDQGPGPHLSFSLPMFEHAREHLDLYRALVGSRGGAIALEAVRQILSEMVHAELVDGAAPREFTVQYLVGAYMAVLTWWLDAGAKLPPEQMDRMFRRLAMPGLAEATP